jgi:hypothetical protein
MKIVYQLYYAEGNLLSERLYPLVDENLEQKEPQIEIEYPDGSKFKGKFSTEEDLTLGQGEFRKKTKNNNSYYKRYTGTYVEGVPDGEDCSLEIKLSQWPRYHALMSKFSSPEENMRYKCCLRR